MWAIAEMGGRRMTIEEAIQHCEEVAYQKDLESGFETDNERYAMTDRERADCKKCASEHRQLAEWLKELKAYKEQSGDAISRQAAIDALHMQIMYRMGTDSNKKRLDDWINGVPSAQPEIVRCGQCKYAEVADAQDNQDGYTCQFHRGSIWFSGSYCSWGERKSDEQV